MTDTSDLFTDYLKRKSPGTIAAQQSDLKHFFDFLQKQNYANHVTCLDDLRFRSAAWATITYPIVQSFIDQQLEAGRAISSINRCLSTIKTYAKLAAKAGQLAAGEYALISCITGYSPTHAKRIDTTRPATRVGKKKVTPIAISPAQASDLKHRPDTPQGRRDRLLMCLLLDHGLRVGEVVMLQADACDLQTGLFSFLRPNLDGEQLHQLTADTRQALAAYIRAGDCPKDGALLRGSLKSGELTHAGITVQAIQARVRLLGEQIGLFGLSPHDCRHYWATYWSDKVDVLRLQEAGGWSSLEMPRRYVERSRIANVGMTDK